jgi:hypothetical protein
MPPASEDAGEWQEDALLNVSSLLTPETAPTGANVMIVIFVEI